MPLGTQKTSLLAAAGADTATNYFGDESDGALTTSGDVTYTVLNKSGSYDGDMVVKQYSALTVSTGDTVTVDQVNRGLFIYVTGDCTINGTLSMRTKGGHCDPTASGGSDSNAVGSDGLELGLRTASGSETFTNDGTGFNGAGNAVRTAIANEEDLAGDGTIYSVTKSGGGSATNGATGAAAIGTGGGGSPGGTGGAFSGGAGSGGVHNHPSRPGAPYGGAGGNGAGGSDLNGGSGNPGGSGYGGGAVGEAGTGGIIWLVVKGNVTVGASGIITAIGGYAGHNQTAGTGGNGGGGSGGGAIQILHGGTYTNGGTVSAAGGVGPGGSGGDGGINSAQVAAA